MTKSYFFVACVAVTCFFNATLNVRAQYQPAGSETIQKATGVLNEFMSMPNEGIPRSMIHKAQGIVIVPNMIKLGFVVGGRHGKGIAVVRDEHGAWHPPSFITMTGGSLGFQAGVQSTDVVLVFNTRKSVNNLLSGKFTIGVDAAAAAGPVGRQAAAATDGQLQAEIYSYSRSRGLFAGASVDGSAIQMDAAATQNFYSAAGMSADGTPMASGAQLPLAAGQFLAALGSYSGGAVAAPGANPPSMPPSIAGAPAANLTTPANVTANPAAGSVLPPGSSTGIPAATGVYPPNSLSPPAATAQQIPAANGAAASLDLTRQELVRSAQSLGALLDEPWRQYLALPQGVFSGKGVPSAASLRQSLERFDAVAKQSKYNLLLQRQEFQQTYGLLRTYLEQVEATTARTGLPSANVTPQTRAQATIR